MKLLLIAVLALVVGSAVPVSAAGGVSLVAVASASTGAGTTKGGAVSVTMAVVQGDFLVVIVGINRAAHPVTAVSDSAGDAFTNRSVAAYPSVAPDAWVNVWTAQVKSTGTDLLTVHTTSTRVNVVVMEYSGVAGVGNVATAGGKSSTARVTLGLKSSSSGVAVGGSTFTGAGKGCGFQAPYSGGAMERCLGTTAAKNNVGTMAMSSGPPEGTSVTVSSGKSGGQSWAMVAVELLGA